MEHVTIDEAWEVLGVEPGASPDEIAAAYRSAAKRAHPDAGGTAEEWARLTEARTAILASTEILHVSAYVDDVYGEHPAKAKVKQWWRVVPRYRRVGLVVLVGGAALGTSAWAFTTWAVANAIPAAIPLVVMTYPAMAWLWLIASEIRRPRLMPLRWVLLQPQTQKEWARAMSETLRAAEAPQDGDPPKRDSH